MHEPERAALTSRPPGGGRPTAAAGRIGQTRDEILRLIEDLGAQRTGRASAPPPAAVTRLEVARWREAFYRDAVMERLGSICGLLEERVAALERDLAAGATPPPCREASPAAARPAEPAAAPAAARPAEPPPGAVERSADALLRGQIQEGVLSDLLQMLSANLKTGRFSVSGPEIAAELWFEEGEIRHAEAGDLRGEDAFFAAMAQQSGSFTFVEGGGAPPERTINNKTQFLILEGLRKMDEELQGGEA